MNLDPNALCILFFTNEVKHKHINHEEWLYKCGSRYKNTNELLLLPTDLLMGIRIKPHLLLYDWNKSKLYPLSI